MRVSWNQIIHIENHGGRCFLWLTFVSWLAVPTSSSFTWSSTINQLWTWERGFLLYCFTPSLAFLGIRSYRLVSFEPNTLSLTPCLNSVCLVSYDIQVNNKHRATLFLIINVSTSGTVDSLFCKHFSILGCCWYKWHHHLSPNFCSNLLDIS